MLHRLFVCHGRRFPTLPFKQSSVPKRIEGVRGQVSNRHRAPSPGCHFYSPSLYILFALTTRSLQPSASLPSTMANSLMTAELAIYALLSLPILYILFRHAPAGLVGWIYLFAFCTIRIVGGAMAMGEDPSTASKTISNVGLSPLLLAVAGILHEAYARSTPSGRFAKTI